MFARGLLTALALLGAMLAGPAAAGATSCAPPASVADGPDRHPVVLVAVAQPGAAAPDGQLVTPATWIVERYEKGDGPRTIQTETAVSGVLGPVSLAPVVHPGDRWRLIGRLDGAFLHADFCAVSVPEAARIEPPTVQSGDRRRTAVRSTYDGTPLTRATAPVLRVAPGRRVVVRLPESPAVPRADVAARLVSGRGSTGLRRTALGGRRFRIAVRPPARGTRTIVLTTREAFFVFRLARTR